MGNTYWMHPSGSNGPGSESEPFLLASSAIAALEPDDTLVLKDGDYTDATNGRFIIIGGSTAMNGTSGDPIHVVAENPRKARFISNGQNVGFQIEDLAYWRFEDIVTRSTDTAAGSGVASNWDIRDCDNLVFRGNLDYMTNRYKNAHVYQALRSTNCLWEDIEYYWYHRHGILWRGVGSFASSGNIARRVYGNGRAWGRIDDPPAVSWVNEPNKIISMYPGKAAPNHDETAINCIVEDDPTIYSPNPNSGFDIQCDGAIERQKYLGCISLNCLRPLTYTMRDNGAGFYNQDFVIQDLLALNSKSHGLRIWNCGPGLFKNITISGAGSHGMIVEQMPTGQVGNGVFEWTGRNIGSINNNGWGLRVLASSWTNSHFGHHNNTGGPTSGSTDVVTADPNLGSTLVWVRPSSPWFEAGHGEGESIGAEILYELNPDGTKTTNPLWNHATGQWLHLGAIVEGVNDIAGASLFDVHERLGISPATLPEGYGGEPPVELFRLESGELLFPADPGTPTHQEIYLTFEDGLTRTLKNIPFSALGMQPDGSGRRNDPATLGLVLPPGETVIIERRPFDGEAPGTLSNDVQYEVPS